jgi:hypothetical protein
MHVTRNFRVLLACDTDKREKVVVGLGTDD